LKKKTKTNVRKKLYRSKVIPRGTSENFGKGKRTNSIDNLKMLLLHAIAELAGEVCAERAARRTRCNHLLHPTSSPSLCRRSASAPAGNIRVESGIPGGGGVTELVN